MSSMGRKTIYSIALMAGTALAFPATAQAQEAGRSSLVAQQPGQMDQAVGQWEYLTARDDLPLLGREFPPAIDFTSTNWPRPRSTATPHRRRIWSHSSIATRC